MVRFYLESSLLLGLLLWACEERPASSGPAASATSVVERPAEPAPSASAAAAPARALGPASIAMSIEWSEPGWKKLDTPPGMRRATYAVPHVPEDSEDAELGVFYFGPIYGGNVDANLKRWAGQFGMNPEQGKRSQLKTKSGLEVELFEIAEGTFQSGPPMGKTVEKPHFGMVGAVVKTATGNYFFKLTGPTATVKAARPKLLELLESIRETG